MELKYWVNLINITNHKLRDALINIEEPQNQSIHSSEIVLVLILALLTL
ncbi:hypothetical protein OTSUT76_3769 [Orientia tsutsugamushi str. UT76]|nr:hypothetical protein OTSUT76_3769 [Orientia tsutsugamushi str. UT76]